MATNCPLLQLIKLGKSLYKPRKLLYCGVVSQAYPCAVQTGFVRQGQSVHLEQTVPPIQQLQCTSSQTWSVNATSQWC